MSASVTSDRSKIRKRGTMLAYIFSNQGWGSFVGSLVTIIVLLAYKHVMNDKGETSKVDGGGSFPDMRVTVLIFFRIVWRIVVGLSLVPAFGTLYQRLTLPESTRYISSRKLRQADDDSSDQIDLEKKKQNVAIVAEEEVVSDENLPNRVAGANVTEAPAKDGAYFKGPFICLTSRLLISFSPQNSSFISQNGGI